MRPLSRSAPAAFDRVRRRLAAVRRHLPVSAAQHRDLARRYDDLARRHHQLGLEKTHIQAVFETWVPPGHFYSPIVSVDEVERRAADLVDTTRDPTGVDLRERDQLALFEALADILGEDLPFPVSPEPGGKLRYHFDNPAYAWSDGLVLHALLRHLRPRRIVEVGSGYSSAMALDTAERWLGGHTDLVFVEPHPELLRSLLRPGDEQRVTIHTLAVQDVPFEVFEQLEAGDVLFVDSTHVVKAGSDVNHLVLEVLPRLAPGVWIHVHDIFFPFEYPLDWLREGRAWQEAYLLRAFLTGNPGFVIRWFQSFMWVRHRPLLESRVPAMAKNPGGNLWLQKVAP